MNGWLVFLGLVAAYMVLLYWLAATDRMRRWNLGLMLGFVLMVRTQRGKGTIDALARPRRLWNLFGDIGSFVTLLLMLGGSALIFLTVLIVANPKSGAPALGFREVLVIPGVNRIVPLWYGIAALIVTLVVHEGGHGILARANGMRVKSLGLLYAIVPIGAFVEPDEEDLKASSRRSRMRVFAAGPMTNLTIAALFVVLFGAMLGSAELRPGAHVTNIVKDGPADRAGIEPLSSIVAFDGQDIPTWEAFSAIMKERHPGDTVNLRLASGEVVTTVLTSEWDSRTQEERDTVLRLDPARADVMQRTAKLGVYGFDDTSDILARPFSSFIAFLTVFQLPMREFFNQEPVLSTYIPHFYEAPFAGWLFWPLLLLVFWIFWMNLAVGFTNVLPIIPLDGGHMFMDALGAVVDRVRPSLDAEARDRIVKRGAGAVTFTLLGAFLATIVLPHLF